MATKKNKKGGGSARAWEIGGALTAATLAAAAGAYLLSDKKTKAKAKKWATGARKELAKKAALAKKLGEREYGRMVDQTIKRYGSLQNVTAADVIAAAKELKGEWKMIHTEAQKMAKAYGSKKTKSTGKKKPARKATHPKKARQ